MRSPRRRYLGQRKRITNFDSHRSANVGRQMFSIRSEHPRKSALGLQSQARVVCLFVGWLERDSVVGLIVATWKK